MAGPWTSKPAASNADTPDGEMPSFANTFIFVYTFFIEDQRIVYAFLSSSLMTSTSVPTLSRLSALYIEAR